MRSPLALGIVGLLLSPTWVRTDPPAWPLPGHSCVPPVPRVSTAQGLSPDYSLGGLGSGGSRASGPEGALLAVPEANRGHYARRNPFPAWPIKPRSEMRARCGLTQNQSHQIWTVSPLSGQCRPGMGGPPYHRKLGFLTSPDGS